MCVCSVSAQTHDSALLLLDHLLQQHSLYLQSLSPLYFTHPLNPSTHTAGTVLTARAWGGGVPVPGHMRGGGRRGWRKGRERGREALWLAEAWFPTNWISDTTVSTPMGFRSQNTHILHTLLHVFVLYLSPSVTTMKVVMMMRMMMKTMSDYPLVTASRGVVLFVCIMCFVNHDWCVSISYESSFNGPGWWMTGTWGNLGKAVNSFDESSFESSTIKLHSIMAFVIK